MGTREKIQREVFILPKFSLTDEIFKYHQSNSSGFYGLEYQNIAKQEIMGATISDIHRDMYGGYRMKGMSHEEAIRKFPAGMREQVEKDVNKPYIESHFGMPNKWFWILMGAVLIAIVVLTIISV